jgi:hypothetical protein
MKPIVWFELMAFLSLFFFTTIFFFHILQMIVFWVISGLQLLLLMKTLPEDQDKMEAELASYAANAIATARKRPSSCDENESLVSIEDRITSFDSTAAKQTLSYVRAGIQELRSPFQCGTLESDREEEDEEESLGSRDDKSSGAEEEDSSTLAEKKKSDMFLTPTQQRQKMFLQQEAESIVIDNTQWTDETLLTPQPQSFHPIGAIDESAPLLM